MLFLCKLRHGIILPPIGQNERPMCNTISTAVENDKISTTITASLIGERWRSPWQAHSHRRSYSAWSKST